MGSAAETRTFGLVAGLGVGAGVFYYKALVDAHLALGLTPRLLMVHADVRFVMSQAAARQTTRLAEYLAGLLQQLARGGAEIAAIPAFSPQVCAAELAAITPLPLISLLDAIADEIVRKGFRRIAIFGARVTMETQMFGRLSNAEVVMPAADEMNAIAEIYVRVVETARASEEDFSRVRTIAHRLIERERLDGIVLAGTDFAFMFNPGNTDFAHVDGARAHVEAIMRRIAPAADASQAGQAIVLS
jgi:aspartate racemase